MKLFGHHDSGHAFKVRFFLKVAEIEHQYEWIDIWAPRESRSEEFQENSTYQEVPLLLHQHNAFIQSNAILIYLAQHIDGYGAEDPEIMSRCYEWLIWEANKIGMCLPQLRSVQRFDGHGINTGARDWLIGRYQHDIGVLETTLHDGRKYIVGDQLSIADFALSGYLFYQGESGVEVPSAVQEWLGRLSKLPGWQHPYELLSPQE